MSEAAMTEWEAAKQKHADEFFERLELYGLDFDKDDNLYHAASGETYWTFDDFNNGIILSARMEMNKR